MKNVGARIKEARERLHLTQDYVARQVGINRSAMADIERGKRKVSAEELGKISELFLIPMEELLHGRETEEPTRVFARKFAALDDDDQREILNLMEFKRAMKAAGGRR